MKPNWNNILSDASKPEFSGLSNEIESSFSFFMYYLCNQQSVNFHQRSQPTTELPLITTVTTQRGQLGKVWTDKSENSLSE